MLYADPPYAPTPLSPYTDPPYKDGGLLSCLPPKRYNMEIKRFIHV